LDAINQVIREIFRFQFFLQQQFIRGITPKQENLQSETQALLVTAWKNSNQDKRQNWGEFSQQQTSEILNLEKYYFVGCRAI
jgi:hypothetical protein